MKNKLFSYICIGGAFNGKCIESDAWLYIGQDVVLRDPDPFPPYTSDGEAKALDFFFHNYVFREVKVNDDTTLKCLTPEYISSTELQLRLLELEIHIFEKQYLFIKEYGLEIAKKVVNGALYGLVVKNRELYELGIKRLKQAIADFELLEPNKLPNDGWYGREDKYGLNGAELYLSMYGQCMPQAEILALQQVIQRVRENINE